MLIQAKLTSFFVRRENKPKAADYLKRVLAIEVTYTDYLTKHGTSPANWHELDAAISVLKNEVMHLYVAGNLEDMDTVPHFLSVVAAAHQRIGGERSSSSARLQKGA